MTEQINSHKKYFYKYRSLKNFEHFADIVNNQRLYAATFTELNDPMEGLFYYFEDEICADIIKELKRMKESLKICSLAKNYKCASMWTHYADNHKGIAIEVSVKDDESYILKDIEYVPKAGFLRKSDNIDFEITKSLLSKKLISWKAEKEVRVFKKVYNDTEPTYIEVEIKKIYTGVRMSDNYYNMLSCFIKEHNEKNRKNIQLCRMNSRKLT